MKIIDVQQGTPEWIAARLGIPTASEFAKIISNSTGELSRSRSNKKEMSDTAKKYAYRLVAETLLGRPMEKPPGSPWAMERGKMLEPLAIQQYSFTNDVDVRRVGFVTTDDGRLGCSPDGLIVGARRGLEIKCTLDENHMGIFIEGPGDDYKPQVMANLAICELDIWDLYAFHPELPPVTIPTGRDEPYIARMDAALREFLDMRDAMLAKARSSGFFEQANDNRPKEEAA
jgi:YqaJ-like viral recombinase domain